MCAQDFSCPTNRRHRLVCCLPVFLGAVCFANLAAGQIPNVPGWDLIWHDEFDGTALDNGQWEALDRRDSYNNEKQYYHPNQVSVADGSLQLTAINVPRAGKAYQSGLITSRDLFGPGRFEARIDLPTSQGMWPAFWLNANHVQWPLGGEIDILENRGSQPFLTSGAYHWQTNPGPCCGQHEFVFGEYSANEGGEPVDFHAGFHTYTAEWSETTVRYYVDDNLYLTVTESGNLPIVETPKNIIVNLAVGGNFGGDPDGSTIWPQTMVVDYVRFWEPQSVQPADFDEDGDVDGDDFLAWQGDFGMSSGATHMQGDADGDGDVDGDDFLVWQSQFNGNNGENSANVAPEPNSIAICAVAMFLFALRLRSETFLAPITGGRS